jgi:hypothetical protein
MNMNVSPRFSLHADNMHKMYSEPSQYTLEAPLKKSMQPVIQQIYSARPLMARASGGEREQKH